jgi:hypothetical protein
MISASADTRREHDRDVDVPWVTFFVIAVCREREAWVDPMLVDETNASPVRAWNLEPVELTDLVQVGEQPAAPAGYDRPAPIDFDAVSRSLLTPRQRLSPSNAAVSASRPRAAPRSGFRSRTSKRFRWPPSPASARRP